MKDKKLIGKAKVQKAKSTFTNLKANPNRFLFSEEKIDEKLFKK